MSYQGESRSIEVVGKIEVTDKKISPSAHTLTHLPTRTDTTTAAETLRNRARHKRYIALSTTYNDNTDEGEGGVTPFVFACAGAYPPLTPISNIDNISNTLC